MFPLWLQAGFWGVVSASALVLGALVGYYVNVPQRLIAATMAFGSGVLISTLAFDLMDNAYVSGGFDATALGFLSGATVYTVANWLLSRHGAKRRKRSSQPQLSEAEVRGSGAAIALGTLLDGIPESIVVGVSLLGDSDVSIVAVIAVFLSNFPEALSGAAGMKDAGRSWRYIIGVWGGIVIASGIASIIGNTVFRGVSPQATALIIAVAAGAILAMLADTMIPEAFETVHNFTGLITAAGFLAAFALTKLTEVAH
jgi:zinc transporter, ZIP family